MENVAKAMANLQKTLKFTALHFDVEPSSISNFEALVNMYATARKYLPVSAILKPGWLSKKMEDLKKISVMILIKNMVNGRHLLMSLWK